MIADPCLTLTSYIILFSCKMSVLWFLTKSGLVFLKVPLNKQGISCTILWRACYMIVRKKQVLSLKVQETCRSVQGQITFAECNPTCMKSTSGTAACYTGHVYQVLLQIHKKIVKAVCPTDFYTDQPTNHMHPFTLHMILMYSKWSFQFKIITNFRREDFLQNFPKSSYEPRISMVYTSPLFF